MVNKKVAVIGLGLIGGSVAKALRLRMGISGISAVDSDESALRQAEQEGIIEEGFTGLNENIYSADIIFICTPVKKTLEYITELSGRVGRDCIVTDVCSTKGELAAFMDNMENAPCFVGGHPMAGSEKNGYLAGTAHLFENAYYILTPCKSSCENAVSTIEGIVRGMGAIPVKMDAVEHDRVIGAISHVPHVVASALVSLAMKTGEGDKMVRLLAAGGFRDITRIASSSPAMWENIVFSNKTRINELIDTLIDILSEYKKAAEAGNSEEILKFFTITKEYRDSLPSVSTGLIQPEFILTVDVEDKPGIIGEIATLLGRNNINIKNINVSNSREFEQGCLRITLPDLESANIGFDLLIASGYKVYMNK